MEATSVVEDLWVTGGLFPSEVAAVVMLTVLWPGTLYAVAFCWE
jgi:hypothetical protein